MENPVPPTPTAELVAMVRTAGDTLNDLVADLVSRGVTDEVFDLVVAARDAAYAAYAAYATPYGSNPAQEELDARTDPPIEYESFGPVVNPDGTPTETTLRMLTGLTPEEQAAEDHAVDHGISYRDSM